MSSATSEAIWRRCFLSRYSFSASWFIHTAEPIWRELFPKHYRPQKVLEIGSYEGMAACWLAERSAESRIPSWFLHRIHCIDTWEGGDEHAGIDMQKVFDAWQSNAAIAAERTGVYLTMVRGESSSELLSMAYAERTYDFIYIDGSHRAADVLRDAVLAWELLEIGGLMIFDDYHWHPGDKDLRKSPKLAIDAFVNCYWDKLKFLGVPASQVCIEKVDN